MKKLKIPLFFLILWLAFFYRSFGGHVLSGGDLVNAYIPYKHIFKQFMKQGIFPLWNPYTFSGRPFQADIQNGLFYPPNWLSLVFPIPVFYTIITIIHLWFASLGAYVFSRRFLKKLPPRILFSLVFSFSAYFTTRLYSGVVLFIFTASFIPWILDAAVKWRKERSNSSIIYLGIMMAMQLLAGSPQVAYYTWFSLGVLFLIQLPGPKAKRSLWKGYAGAIILMVAITAIQFLPTKEYIDRSYDRAGGARWEYITNGSLHPRCLITFIAPHFFSHPRREEIFWAPLRGFWEFNGYAGIAPIILSLVCLVFYLRRKKSRSPTLDARSRFFLFALILFLLWLLLAFGKYSPVFRLFYMIVPGFNRFREPARIVIYYILALSIFSSLGLQRLMEICYPDNGGKKEDKKPALFSVIIIFIIGMGATLSFFLMPKTILRFFGITNYIPLSVLSESSGAASHFIRAAKNSMALFSVFLFISTFLIMTLIRTGIKYRFLPYILLGSLIVDLFIFGIPQIETVPYRNFYETFYPDSSLSRFLKNASDNHQRIAWTDDVFWWMNDQNQMELYPNRAILKGLYDIRGYDPVFQKSYGEYFNAISFYRGEKSPGGLLSMVRVHNPTLLTLLNVRYLLSYSSKVSPPGWDLVKTYPFGLRVLENTKPAGNAFLARHFPVPYEKEDVVIGILQNPKAPLDRMAFSTGENPREKESLGEGKKEETVKLLSYSPNRREYSVFCHQSDILVFSEKYYPGWRVYVDGEKTRLEVVDHALMGVFINPGQHRIVCVLRPLSFVLGAVITLLTCLFVLLWLANERRKRHG